MGPLRTCPIVNHIYLLRSCHHVIDVIGVLEECNENIKYLVVMQISLREYRLHEKKSDDLFSIITAPECSKSLQLSIYQYYKQLCSGHGIRDNIIYTYVSPKV